MKAIISILLLTITSVIFSQGTEYITENTTWSGQKFLENIVIVNDGYTLTIQPGAIIKFAPGTRLIVYGTLSAIGNSGSPIYFTSSNDNTVGTTVGSSTGSPQKGDWNGIYMYGAYVQGIGLFDYCIIKYGGGGGDFPSNLSIYGGYVDFTNSTSSESASYGYWHTSYASIIENCTFENNEYAGLYYDCNDSKNTPSILNNTFTTNYDYAAIIKGSTLPTISGNTGNGNTINKISVSGSVRTSKTWSVDDNLFIVFSNAVSVNSGATLTFSTGTFDFGNYYLYGSGGLTVNSGVNLYIRSVYGIKSSDAQGNILLGGTRDLSTSANYFYLGTELQQTGNLLPTEVNNLTISNSAGISMTNNISVGGTLSMANGNITTNLNTLTLGTSTSNLGTLNYTDGKVIGNFKRWFAALTVSNNEFPIGTVSDSRKVNLSYTSAPSSGGTLTASFIDSSPGTSGLPLDDNGTQITNCSSEGYWQLLAENGLTGGEYNMDLTAENFSGISNVSSLRIINRTSGGADWTVDGTHSNGTGTTSLSIVHRTGLTGYSEFGIGSSSENALPVELVYFNATPQENNILLQWSTATEINNYGFEILRFTDKGDETMLGFIAGYGNSNSNKEYEFIDESPKAGNLEYKLKQINTDGTSKIYDITAHVNYSQITDVDEFSDLPGEYQLYPNYPNPFNPTTTILYQIPNTSVVRLSVYDVLGREIKILLNDQIKNQGVYQATWNANQFSSGIYLVFMKAVSVDNKEEYSFVQKMILNK